MPVQDPPRKKPLEGDKTIQPKPVKDPPKKNGEK